MLRRLAMALLRAARRWSCAVWVYATRLQIAWWTALADVRMRRADRAFRAGFRATLTRDRTSRRLAWLVERAASHAKKEDRK